MKRPILAKAAFSMAVAATLGMGVRDAAAAPETAAKRPYCANTIQCEDICESMYPGQPVAGYCSPGHTCYCYL